MAESFSFADTVGPFGVLTWRAVIPEKGVLHILHGMAEHMARYEAFAHHMVAHGISVYANDHPGHGTQAGHNLGHLEPHGWHQVLQRISEVRAWIRGRHPLTFPHILL